MIFLQMLSFTTLFSLFKFVIILIKRKYNLLCICHNPIRRDDYLKYKAIFKVDSSTFSISLFKSSEMLDFQFLCIVLSKITRLDVNGTTLNCIAKVQFRFFLPIFLQKGVFSVFREILNYF